MRYHHKPSVLTAATSGVSLMLTAFILRMLKRLWKTNAPLTMTGLLMLPALAIAMVGMIVDQLIIAGAPAWLKPAKFTISIPV